jgi:hypothetical protein
MRNTPLTRLLGYLWLGLLGLALFLSAAGAHLRSMAWEEYPKCCDAFGYLRMAKEVRRAVSRGEYPDYRLDSPHIRLLIDLMQSHNEPLPAWDAFIAPHAHHYFPRAGRVGVQYPPGTGLVLALFPEGIAVHRLNRFVVALFLVVGLGILVLAARNQSWAAAGGVIFALQLGLEILGWVGDSSYSINVILAPLLLSFLLLYLALVLRLGAERASAAACVAFLSGACFGFAMLVRLPLLFLLPGALWLLYETTHWINRSIIAFLLGWMLCGVLPLLLHQQQVAGAWYLSTYDDKDGALPNLTVVPTNLLYYFVRGDGDRYNGALVISLIGFVGVATLTSKAGKQPSRLTWHRIVLSALLLWGISTLYFLTHRITVPYYQLPAILAAVFILAMGGLTFDGVASKPADDERIERGSVWHRLALIAAFIPGLAAMERAWETRPQMHLPAEASAHQPQIPAELLGENVWIFGHDLTGTLWYYAEQTAHSPTRTNTKTRALVYRFICDRGDLQYVIRDNDEMDSILNEIQQMGGTLEPRGEVEGRPYYRVSWPQGGPEIEPRLKTLP